METLVGYSTLTDGTGGQLGPLTPFILYAMQFTISSGAGSSIIKATDDSGAAVFSLPRTAGCYVWTFPEGVLITDGLWGDIAAECVICTITYQNL